MSSEQDDFGVLNMCHSDQSVYRLHGRSMANVYPGLDSIPTYHQHTLQTFRLDHYVTSSQFFVGIQGESRQPMDIASDINQSISFEHVRLTSGAAPPKRFYRTFWRSAARRMLAKTDTQMQN